MPRDKYGAARRGRDGKVHGGLAFRDEGEASTIQYSTKVLFCDKVQEALILER